MVQLLNQRKHIDFKYDQEGISVQGYFVFTSDNRIIDLWASITDAETPAGSFSFSENAEGTINKSLTGIPDSKETIISEMINTIIADIKSQLIN